jgi:UDP-glucose 4-epimerase
MTRTALICGGKGFIGRYCMPAFHEKGWKVFGAGHAASLRHTDACAYFPGDFRDAGYVDILLNETRPERLVFAAGPASVDASFADPVDDFTNHMLPLIRVLDRARRLKNPPGILLVSSAAVYGNPLAIPVTEEALCAPMSPYGFHKLQQEGLLDEFATLYGLPTCKARVFSTYGAGLRRLAVWDIARRVLNGDFTIEGAEGDSRDYLHVSDTARALERICDAAPFAGECINVASGTEATMERVAKLIYEALGANRNPAYSGSRGQGKPYRWCANVTRLNELGFRPSMTLEEGLQDAVAWARANA